MGQIVCDLIEQNENLVLKCGFDKNITGEFAFPVYDKIENIDMENKKMVVHLISGLI